MTTKLITAEELYSGRILKVNGVVNIVLFRNNLNFLLLSYRWTGEFYLVISQGREGVVRERVQRMRQISCVVLALKKAGFYRYGVLFY